ncbi:TetR/AcrR family transcriptional regulator [Shimia aestuarii]|uniref:Transcriptional regulator, TetR family n=1 Tax=Shimia aestuarii TaxID=254406 RepID=A0A1I4Q804_9RHOB|nr:TetR/AcrR family transcriptional regulator [Shimia aestuarii]SFM36212.1 transcriptional regulator, TetR family [Shimia aestuarii]
MPAAAKIQKGGENRFDAILDAAEVEFAESGYDGASLRVIAQRANVAQALIHYHFKNKSRLFEAMVARRAEFINGTRAALLAALFDQPQDPTLETVVDSLFRPTIEVGREDEADMGAYARILASVANSADARDQALAEKYYDPIAIKYIDALQRVVPGLSRPDAVWAYLFAIGVGVTMMAKTGRPGRLSEGACDDRDADAMMSRIVPFVCGGIRALV